MKHTRRPIGSSVTARYYTFFPTSLNILSTRPLPAAVFFVIFMSFTKMMMIAGSLFLEVGKELPKWQWSISTNA